MRYVRSRGEHGERQMWRLESAEEEMRRVQKRVKTCLQGSGELTDTTLRKAIDGMDTIINSL